MPDITRESYHRSYMHYASQSRRAAATTRLPAAISRKPTLHDLRRDLITHADAIARRRENVDAACRPVFFSASQR